MKKVDMFVSMLFFSRDQMHLWHLQTRGYAQHKALDSYYSEVLSLTDEFLECYMAKGEKIKYAGAVKLVDYTGKVEQIYDHLTKMRNYLVEVRKEMSSRTNLQNIVDEFLSLIDKTEYMLTMS